MIRRVEHIIFIVLLVIVAIIVNLHFSYHWVRVLDMPTSIFYLDEKVTIGAYYTVVVAILAGSLHLLLSLDIKEKFRRTSAILVGLLLVAISADEFFELHEYINTLIKASLSSESTLGALAQRSWIFPLAGIVIVAAAIVLRAIIVEKDRMIRIAYLLGISSFAAIIVLELVGGGNYGKDVYLSYVGYEEGMEMLGVSSFMWAALLKYFRLRKVTKSSKP